ncbi:MAG TPA: LacI family DNA-binding transcriptional regulator [Niallia sp.]|nr:LacI family DNA-binding transcriptional regulator [Niallia sp.]
MTNIRDLANMAGVSVTTVSRVLNNQPYVSEEKRRAVLKAIESTNYYRNINAVHLSKGKTQLMGVVIPYIDLPYFSLLLKGIGKKALENNYKLVLFQTDYSETKEMEALQMLKQKQIDSLIFCSRKCDLSIIEEHLQYGNIVVCENTEDRNIASSYVDHYKIFSHVLEYLFDKGHKKIGYCIGRQDGASSFYRKLAYMDFLSKYNLPFNKEYIMDECYYFEDGEKVIEGISNLEHPPTAFIVTSEQVAAGMVVCSQKVGISIPDDLAIIGIGNDSIAKLMNITAIDIPLIALGKSLFQQALHEDISSKELEVQLIERETV